MFIKIHIKFKLYEVRMVCVCESVCVDGHRHPNHIPLPLALLYFHAIFLGYGFDHRRAELLGMKTKTTTNGLIFENDARGYCCRTKRKRSKQRPQKQRDDDDQWF